MTGLGPYVRGTWPISGRLIRTESDSVRWNCRSLTRLHLFASRYWRSIRRWLSWAARRTPKACFGNKWRRIRLRISWHLLASSSQLTGISTGQTKAMSWLISSREVNLPTLPLGCVESTNVTNRQHLVLLTAPETPRPFIFASCALLGTFSCNHISTRIERLYQGPSDTRLPLFYS